MLLSICILSMPHRSWMLSRLMNVLTPQLTTDVEVMLSISAGHDVAERRNQLLDAARGQYITYIDDDDLIAPNYVAAIRAALADSPDCVTFDVTRYEDGQRIGHAEHRLAHESYRQRRIVDRSSTKRVWIRPPNHLCPVRTDLARQVRFDPRQKMEDVDYATRLRPLLSSEVHIDEELYQYLLVSPHHRDPRERAA